MKLLLPILCVLLGGEAVAQTSDIQVEQSIEKALLAIPIEQITLAKKLLDERQKASTESIHGPANGTPITVRVDFRGGKPKEPLKLVTSKLSVVGIYDRLMQPWPIKYLRQSTTDRFEILRDEKPGFHNFTLKSMQPYARGNIVLFLEGLDEPIILDLETKQKTFNDKINIVIPHLAPGTKISLQPEAEGLLNTTSSAIYYGFMDGRAPDGAISITILNNFIVEAWRFQGELLVLSRKPLLGLIKAQFNTVDKLLFYVFEDVGEFGISLPDEGIQMIEVPRGN